MNTQHSTDKYLHECRAAFKSEQALSLAKTDNWSHVDKQRAHLDWDALYKELAPMVQRLPPSASQVQAVIDKHYRLVSRFYKPSRLAYIGMSLFYGDDQGMKNFHNAYHPKMVEFLREAMPIYAHRNL